MLPVLVQVERTTNSVVVRRAAAFQLTVQLNQPVDIKKKHKLKFTFSYGETVSNSHLATVRQSKVHFQLW